jgi:3'-phosphoadenosine 5'-phosphosulfate sulfotransferase (PAPS reductase)/FAD synthetase
MMIKQHIVAFSGGKDSAAMLLRMIELGMPIDKILFCDTTKEFPQLMAYIKRMDAYTRKTIGVPVTTLKSKKTWDDWFFGEISRGDRKGQKRGWPLMAFHCWWSRESKFKLMDPICLGHERYIGFGANEVKRVVAGRKKEGYNFPLADWDWTEAQALEYLEQRGWAEQYHRDFNRTGCYFCPKQGIPALKTLCEKYPVQWSELMRYAKAAHEGEDYASNNFRPEIGYPELIELEEQVKNETN